MESEHLTEERARMARALANGGYDDVHIISHQSANQVLTPERSRIIGYLFQQEAESVSGLAKALDREKGAVSRDLSVLAQHDVIELVDHGNRKTPELKHETVVVEPIYSK